MEHLVSITTSEFKLGVIDSPLGPGPWWALAGRATGMGLLGYKCPGTV